MPITQNESKTSSTNRIELDDDLEKAMDPKNSRFAVMNDVMAMQRQEMVLQMNNRLAIYREFLSSEHGYIKDLTVLKDVFQTSFVNNLSKKDPLLSEAEIETVFCNVERIIQVHLLLSIHFRFIPNFIWLSKNISPKFVSHN